MKIHRCGLSASLVAILLAVLAIAFSTSSSAQREDQSTGRVDPIAGFLFRVEIEGIPQSFGISVQGIQSESEIMQVRQGNTNTTTMTPGAVKQSKLEVSQALTSRHEFFNWRQAVLTGQPSAYRTVSIVLVGTNQKDLFRMTFYRCWPTKWKGPDLNPKSNSIATESLELVYERMEIK